MRRVLGAFAAALLAAPHVAPAATCATQNVPAATLLVPYFLVSRNGSQGEDIPEGGADTLLSITNTGSTGLVVQTTVWSKYGKPVLSFNVPMTAFDVVFFRMKDVLNGKLNVNPNTQRLSQGRDPCGLNASTGAYAPTTGFGATRYVRFANPDEEDRRRAVAVYPAPAFDGAFRSRLWDSLDESGDVLSMVQAGSPGILDADNPACGLVEDGVLSGDFSGFVTLDVVNHCTTILPQDPRWYRNDVVATAGWFPVPGYSPNVLMGDVFFVDSRAGSSAAGSSLNAGHVSGDGMVSLPFEPSLVWGESPTFYSRFTPMETVAGTEAPEAFRFRGDGRTPLGTRYAFRFLSDEEAGLQSWILVFRWDLTPSKTGHDTDLCGWLRECVTGGPCYGYGFWEPALQLGVRTYDNDENQFVPGSFPARPALECFTFLDSQRISLRTQELNPAAFRSGWMDVTLPGGPLTGQAWVSVQHSGPGLALSAGHAATVLTPALPCAPVAR